jgi:hypothetical protein
MSTARSPSPVSSLQESGEDWSLESGELSLGVQWLLSFKYRCLFQVTVRDGSSRTKITFSMLKIIICSSPTYQVLVQITTYCLTCRKMRGFKRLDGSSCFLFRYPKPSPRFSRVRCSRKSNRQLADHDR